MNRTFSAIVGLTLLLAGQLAAQDGPRFPHHPASTAWAPSDTRFDVLYYRLHLIMDTDLQTITGGVTMRARAIADSLGDVRLDLAVSLQVDSVMSGQSHLLYAQTHGELRISLDRAVLAGEVFEITTFYRGTPGGSGFGSFVFSSHNGIPWVWSLSEPYGARDWWPCKDHPSDKADSVDVLITCDSSFKAASNGLLMSVTNHGDGTGTYHWKERYPIATYLVSITVTNFAEFTDWFHHTPGDSMRILNYVLPEHYAEAVEDLSVTADMLRVFSELFGLYPFHLEKYGHAEFGWGGAMEHQTMTSITFPFRESTIAHELAHQWFGDLITMRTWPDIWLNEGFASYAEALWAESKNGFTAYAEIIRNAMNLAETADGTLYVQDTTRVEELFDLRRSYKKGSLVLHMLRHVLGDSVFFMALRQYVHDSTVRFATASTGDFRRVCEQTSGRDLGYFFEQWVFGEKYPRYTYSWNSVATDSGYILKLWISQTTGTSNPLFFKMPIDFKCTAFPWDTTFVLFNDQQDQQFEIPHLSHRPVHVQLDPDEWILKTATAVDSQGRPLNPYRLGLYPNFPNPFNGRTVIPYELPQESDVVLEIYNVLGERVRTLLTTRLWRGPHQITWDGKDPHGRPVASGMYICRLTAGGASTARKILLIK